MKSLPGKQLLFVLFMACLFLAFSGCSEDEECREAPGPCGDFTACCTTSDCHYLADDGKRFDCNGTDCSEAAVALADYMCGALRETSPEDFDRVVEEILNAAAEQVTISFF